MDQLISLLGGFTKNADINNIEITRFISDTEKKIININNHKQITDLYIKDEDHVIIRYKQDYKRQDLVTVNGEVKYPGLYSISHNSTTIKEIIERQWYNRTDSPRSDTPRRLLTGMDLVCF